MRRIACWVICTTVPLVVFYVAVPIVTYCFPTVLHHLVFLNLAKLPFRNYVNLTYYGIRAQGRNFYLQEADDIRLGCWHILPRSLSSERVMSEDEIEMSLKSTQYPVVIYLHGNAFDRTALHRRELYNLLSTMDFHVIAIDYRGYGDSSGHPSEDGVVKDAKATVDYVRKLAPSSEIFVWGHSMGTGVGTRAVMELSEEGAAPKGLVLEAPFNSLEGVIMRHPLSSPFRWLPGFHEVIVRPMKITGLSMTSDVYIKSVSCPILILHAVDDHIIPVQLARSLRAVALEADRDVSYIEFEAVRQFEHKNIYKAEELPAIVGDFAEKCLKRSHRQG